MVNTVEQDESVDLEYVSSVLNQHEGERGGLIPIMQKVQTRFGYLPKSAISMMADRLRVSESQILGVATFYAQFRTKPRGKYMIKICCGTACHVKGSQKLVEITKEETKVALGDTTDNKMVTAERVACIGACSLAPVITINSDAVGYLVADDYRKIVQDCLEDKHQ